MELTTLGKLEAGWDALGRKINPWVVGAGKLPRGKVGLIFAGDGLAHGVIAQGEYGAILVVLVLTTLLSSIALKLLFKG